MLARQQEVFAGFLTHTDAQIGRVLSSLESLGALDNTLVMVFSDNGASAEGGQGRQRQRAPLHRARPRVGGRQPGPLRRLGRLHAPTTTTRGPGPGRATRRTSSGSATPGWAGPARRSSCTGPDGSPSPGAVRAQFAHAIDLMPTIMGAAGPRDPRRGRRRGPAAGRRRQPPRPRSRTRRRPELHAHAVLRDDGLALHLPRGLEGDDQPHQHRRPRRGGARRRQPQLRRGPLGALRPLDGLLRGDRPRRRRAGTAAAAARRCGTPRRSATTSCPSPTAWSTGSRGSSRPPGRPAPSRTFRPGGGPVADESVPLLWGGFRMTADIDTDHERGRRRRLRPRRLVRRLRPLPGRRARPTSPSPERPTRSSWRRRPAARGGPPRARRLLRRRRGRGCRADGPAGVDGAEVDDDRGRGHAAAGLQHGGAGLRLGCDSGFPVSARYTPPAPFTGTVHRSRIDTPGSLRPGPADEVRAALHAD